MKNSETVIVHQENEADYVKLDSQVVEIKKDQPDFTATKQGDVNIDEEYFK